ncbi:unnamed protein product [Discula destructiva]
MASTCSCRTTALRTFVRSVTQVHSPNDKLARAAPWHHEARRQLHQARTTRWSAVAALPYRSVRTASTDACVEAVQTEDGQQVADAEEEPPVAVAVAVPAAAAETQQPAAPSHHGESSVSAHDDVVADEGSAFSEVAAPALSGHEMLAREAAAEAAKLDAKPEPFSSTKRRGRPQKSQASEAPDQDPETAAMAELEAKLATTVIKNKPKKARPQKSQAYEQPAEDPYVETVSVAEIEAEERARHAQIQILRAQRKLEREKAKKEEEQHRKIERQRLEKERLQNRPAWAVQKEALKKKFPEGWQPRRKLSPDALSGIRALHQQFPDTYTTAVLANKFEVSPEAIRRILKSKWESDMDVETEEDRQRRWHNRGVSIWEHYAAIGKKPPAKWRDAGVGVRPALADREQGDNNARGWYDEEMEGDGVDPEQVRRLRMRKKLAKRLF